MPSETPSPGILVTWANLSNPARSWYEDTFIPSVRTKPSNNSTAVLHCEITASGMEADPVGRLDAPWPYMTCYDVRDVDAMAKLLLDKEEQPPKELFEGVLKDARFDNRLYREVKSWQDEDWDRDVEYIASVAVMEWHVTDPSQEADVVKYYIEQVGPTIASSPDVIRFRFFEIENALVQVGASSFEKEKETLHKYFTVVEIETEQWPWDVIVDLAADEKWSRYFESQTVAKWQLSHFLVKKAYNKETPNGTGGARSPER